MRKIWAKWFKTQILKKRNWLNKQSKLIKSTIKASWTSTHRNMYFRNYKSTVAKKYNSRENTSTAIKHQTIILIKMSINSSIKEFSKSKTFLITIMNYIKIPLKLRGKFLIMFKINHLNKSRVIIKETYKINTNHQTTQMKMMIWVNLIQSFLSNKFKILRNKHKLRFLISIYRMLIAVKSQNNI